MATMYDTLIATGTQLIRQHGLAGWSLETLSQAAGCAKGLVNYHFGSKDTLLLLIRQRLEFERREARLAALQAARGTGALDQLWEVLAREVASGGFGGWLDLVRHFGPATDGAASADDDRLATTAARALGMPEHDLAEQAPLLGPALDGLQLRLLQGETPARVREGYERLWLGVL